MKRDFNKINVVYCPKDAKYFGQYTEAKNCKDCCFCETIDKDSINCIYDADIFVNHPQAEDLWACHEQSSL